MKYLRITLDSRLGFKMHFAIMLSHVERVAALLERLLPNIGGPADKVRALWS